jgi:hypothetical protein
MKFSYPIHKKPKELHLGYETTYVKLQTWEETDFCHLFYLERKLFITRLLFLVL